MVLAWGSPLAALRACLWESHMWVPEAVWMSTSRRAEKVGPSRGWGSPGRNPGRVLYLTREPPSLVLSARGGPPGQEQPGSQLEARRLPQTKRRGGRGLPPPNPVCRVQSHHPWALLPECWPIPQGHGKPQCLQGHHYLLWVKHRSSSFSTAGITQEP